MATSTGEQHTLGESHGNSAEELSEVVSPPKKLLWAEMADEDDDEMEETRAEWARARMEEQRQAAFSLAATHSSAQQAVTPSRSSNGKGGGRRGPSGRRSPRGQPIKPADSLAMWQSAIQEQKAKNLVTPPKSARKGMSSRATDLAATSSVDMMRLNTVASAVTPRTVPSEGILDRKSRLSGLRSLSAFLSGNADLPKKHGSVSAPTIGEVPAENREIDGPEQQTEAKKTDMPVPVAVKVDDKAVCGQSGLERTERRDLVRPSALGEGDDENSSAAGSTTVESVCEDDEDASDKDEAKTETEADTKEEELSKAEGAEQAEESGRPSDCEGDLKDSSPYIPLPSKMRAWAEDYSTGQDYSPTMLSAEAPEFTPRSVLMSSSSVQEAEQPKFDEVLEPIFKKLDNGDVEFSTAFDIWYTDPDNVNRKGVDKNAYAGAMQKVGTFNLLSEFYEFHDTVEWEGIKEGSIIAYCREGITPQWEDPANERGGRYLVKNLPRQATETLFTKIALGFFTQMLHDWNKLNLVSLHVRGSSRGSDIQIWRRDRENKPPNSVIKQDVFSMLEESTAPPTLSLTFVPNSDSLSRNDSKLALKSGRSSTTRKIDPSSYDGDNGKLSVEKQAELIFGAADRKTGGLSAEARAAIAAKAAEEERKEAIKDSQRNLRKAPGSAALTNSASTVEPSEESISRTESRDNSAGEFSDASASSPNAWRSVYKPSAGKCPYPSYEKPENAGLWLQGQGILSGNPFALLSD